MPDSRLDATVDEIFRAHVQRYERRMRLLATEGRTEPDWQRMERLSELLWPADSSYPAQHISIADARWLFEQTRSRDGR